MSSTAEKDLVPDEVKSSDSGATSEDYEIVKESSPSSDTDRLVVHDEKETLEESLKECMEENNAAADTSTVINNENLLEDPDHTIFHNVTYLGSVRVDNPKDEAVIQDHMRVLNESSVSPLSVTVSVPKNSNDSVVLRDMNTRTRVAQFRIHRIIFFARGLADSDEKSCFAFTSAVGDAHSGHSHIVQCHVFRCQEPEAVSKIFVSFARAFKKPEGEPVARSPQSQNEEEHIVFEVGLEIREDDGKGNFTYVPRDKDCFKLRSNVEKSVVISLCQVSDNLTQLKVDRCFGMLVSPGRNVRHSDMQLLESVRMSSAMNQWQIQGSWDPREAAFAVLNQETGPEIQSVYMTVAADLVLNQIAEPVRFVVETKVRIFPSTERFWYYTKRTVVRRYRLVVRRGVDGGDSLMLVEVVAGEEVAQPQQGRMSALTSQLATLTSSWRGQEVTETESLSPVDDADDDSGDEPVLSGSGGVSKECSETELQGWADVLKDWPPGGQRPRQLSSLVKAGVPEALRGEVWQRLSMASEKMDLTIENYRELVTKESPDEKVIFRDIHRTFPAHEFFKESGGGGQEALYRISKAYSVYDSEIGYCQGQSFLIAALLLQMPEEQAFGVLVEIMFAYGLRDLYRENFEQLQLRFYQLNRLLEKNMPDLWQHFQNVGLETHMFASQWFLTLFSAKFPLFLVFRVLDVFMLQGIETIFQVSLALLMMVRKELLAQDFEGIMKYFRVNIPKKLRSEEHAKHLMKTVVSIKIRKLNKYEKEWRHKLEEERLAEDPVTRYERENKKLISDNMRLERENDMLAQQLLTRQITMRAEIDKLEDMNANLEKEVMLVRKDLGEKSDEKSMLAEEAEQLKLVLKREVDRMETELKIKDNIITDYKKITGQLSNKVERLEAGDSGSVSPVSDDNPLTTALDRIKELELELAQTKLALVETECKNQDLTHQFISHSQGQDARTPVSSNTWFTKTLSSIKEVAGAKTGRPTLSSSSSSSSQSDAIKKSTSEQVLGSSSVGKAS